MRLAMTLCLVSVLVVLGGCCGTGGCGVAKSPSRYGPAGYGSASGSASGSTSDSSRSARARTVYQRAPRAVVREAQPRPRAEGERHDYVGHDAQQDAQVLPPKGRDRLGRAHPAFVGLGVHCKLWFLQSFSQKFLGNFFCGQFFFLFSFFSFFFFLFL